MNEQAIDKVFNSNPPDHINGYPEYQLEGILEDIVVESATMNNFFEFITGQGIGIDNGEPIYYVADVRRFLKMCK